MNPGAVKYALRSGQFAPMSNVSLGSAVPIGSQRQTQWLSQHAFRAAGTPYSTAGTPYSAAGTPYSSAGTPSRVLRAAAEGDEDALEPLAKMYNPCVESVLNPALAVQWSGNFEYFTAPVSVGSYHELTIGTGLFNGDLIVVLPARNATPDVFVLGRGTNDRGLLVPSVTTLPASRDLFASYTRGRTVSLHTQLTSASQSTTGARTPGYLHAFALQSLRDVSNATRSPNELMPQTITPSDISLQNDTFGGVCGVLAPDGVSVNLKQFLTDQVETSSSTWHIRTPDTDANIVNNTVNTRLWQVPNGEFIFNDRPISVTVPVRSNGGAVPDIDTHLRLVWLSRAENGTVNTINEDGPAFRLSGPNPHATMEFVSESQATITRRLVEVELVSNSANTVTLNIEPGRISISGYLDPGQFSAPQIFMPTAFANTSSVTLRTRFLAQVVPNQQTIADVPTQPTAHSAMTRADIEATSALFENAGPLRRVMSLREYVDMLCCAQNYVLGGRMPTVSAAFRSAGARNAAYRAAYHSDGGFLDFLGNIGKGILGALPVAGQIASTVAPLFADQNTPRPMLLGTGGAGRRAIGYAAPRGHPGHGTPRRRQRPREDRDEEARRRQRAKTGGLHTEAHKAQRMRRAGSMETQTGSTTSGRCNKHRRG